MLGPWQVRRSRPPSGGGWPRWPPPCPRPAAAAAAPAVAGAGPLPRTAMAGCWPGPSTRSPGPMPPWPWPATGPAASWWCWPWPRSAWPRRAWSAPTRWTGWTGSRPGPAATPGRWRRRPAIRSSWTWPRPSGGPPDTRFALLVRGRHAVPLADPRCYATRRRPWAAGPAATCCLRRPATRPRPVPARRRCHPGLVPVGPAHPGPAAHPPPASALLPSPRRGPAGRARPRLSPRVLLPGKDPGPRGTNHRGRLGFRPQDPDRRRWLPWPSATWSS